MKTSLLNFPTDTELVLHLLKEELKMARFFAELDNLGLENNSRYQLNITPLILKYIGLDSDDATIEKYMRLLDEHVENIEPTNESISKEAMALFSKLTAMNK